MKKNVLQLIGSFHQGGSERQAVQLLRLLKEEGTFNLVLATLNKEGVLLREVEGLGFVKIAEFPLTSFFNLRFVRQVKEFAGFLRDNKIDILHTHDFYTNVFGILAAKYAGVSIKIASKRETKGVRSKNQEFIEKNIFKFADKIVSNSKAVKKYLTDKNVGDEKIEVVYNGVDLERLEPSEKDRTAICNSLSLPVDDKVKFITLVANLHHDVKNQEMLLRAAKSITKDFSNAHFVFAGEGSRKDKLEELAKEYGVFENSHFIGRCEKVPELLSISYTCVLTSTAEGFSKFNSRVYGGVKTSYSNRCWRGK